MKSYSDQQNAELKNRVKELEAALRVTRNEIDLPDHIEEIINKALKK